jgi:hypothetical protein
MSSGDHPILIQDAGATSVSAEPPQRHHRRILSLRCVGAIYNAVIGDHILKTLR